MKSFIQDQDCMVSSFEIGFGPSCFVVGFESILGLDDNLPWVSSDTCR